MEGVSTQILDMTLVSVDLIDDREDKLREVRDKDYLGRLKRSIQNAGTVYQPITVVNHPDKNGRFILSDGAHRLAAVRELGWKEIPAVILDLEVDELNLQQILANDIRKQNTRMEVANTLQRMIALPKYSGLTNKQLLDALGLDKSVSWLDNQLKLNNLIPEIKLKVQEGDITMSNASWLGRLPADEQLDFVNDAKNEAPDKFVAIVQARLKELKAEAQGKSKASIDPLSYAKVRSKKDLKSHYADLESKAKANPDDMYIAGQLEGVAFAISMDSETRKAKEAEKKAKEELKQQFTKERNEMLERQRKIAEAHAAKMAEDN